MFTTDFLVIGSGIAGLVYALDVAELGKVTIVSKSNPNEGNTRYAQGGIAGVSDPEDSIESHVVDTITAGAGLCQKNVVETVVQAGPDSIRFLEQMGVVFDLASDHKHFSLGKEGGHTHRRIFHAGDSTGAEIQRALYEKARRHPNIEWIPDQLAIDLIHRDGPNGREVVGAYLFDTGNSSVRSISAKVCMLASGGAGKVYLYTSNPDVATGDGVAMAFRAGARVGNMEFVQFHPTCLFHAQAKNFLITEAMRGEGAILRTIRGDRFMPRYHPLAELAPRDIVARAIDQEMKISGDDYVLLDISHKDPEFLKSRFPTIYQTTKRFGFDITAGPLPVVPAAHYFCGGVLTNLDGETSLSRLFAAGEAACTGLHGANRLASNSLLEAIVFARRAAAKVKSNWAAYSEPGAAPTWDPGKAVRSTEEVLVSFHWDEVRRLMWNLVGIVRSDKRLALAEKRLHSIREEVREYYWKFVVTSNLLELRNLILVAELIVASAKSRRESRGLHFSVDFPNTDDLHFLHDTVVGAGANGEILLLSEDSPSPSIH